MTKSRTNTGVEQTIEMIRATCPQYATGGSVKAFHDETTHGRTYVGCLKVAARRDLRNTAAEFDTVSKLTTQLLHFVPGGSIHSALADGFRMLNNEVMEERSSFEASDGRGEDSFIDALDASMSGELSEEDREAMEEDAYFARLNEDAGVDAFRSKPPHAFFDERGPSASPLPKTTRRGRRQPYDRHVTTSQDAYAPKGVDARRAASRRADNERRMALAGKLMKAGYARGKAWGIAARENFNRPLP